MAKTVNNGVPREFDEQLEALATYVTQKGLTTTGVDASELTADLARQRNDRQKDLELSREAMAFHKAFLTAQSERYGRFIKALKVLRAAHRDDPEVQSALRQFKRRVRRPGPSSEASSDAA
jgi:hypothetical protein